MLVDYEKLYNQANKDFDLFYDLIVEELIEQDKIIKKLEKKSKFTSFYEACELFKPELPKIVRFKKRYEKDVDVSKIEMFLNNDFMVNVERAKAKTMEDVLDNENIKHYRGRACCPLCDSDNNTTLSFKDKFFTCFKCKEKGDQISFIMSLHNLKFGSAINYLLTL